MSSKAIQCPQCHTEIEISEVLSQQIETDLKKSLLAESEQKMKQAVELAKKQTEQDLSVKLGNLQSQLKDQQDLLERAKNKEQQINQQKRDLQKQQEQLDDELEKRLKQKEAALRSELSVSIKQESALELNDLQAQLQEKETKVAEAQQKELEFRKQARALEDKQKELEIEVERRLDQSKREIEENLALKYAEQSELKLKEKEKQISDLRQSLDIARRKSDQGSSETQGEALELDLETRLATEFPHDMITPVPKGVKGADVIQTVKDNTMNECGKIIWEAKNTKNWSPGWLQKLKDDQRTIGANIAILVSVALPENVKGFGVIEGIWVSDIRSYLPLALALREQLIQVNFARAATEGKSDKMEVMFNYLSGDEFRQRVEAIVETFNAMQNQLNREKRAMERIWKEREKQIERITSNTIGMYGDVRGIIGSSVQTIKALELDEYLEEEQSQVQLTLTEKKEE